MNVAMIKIIVIIRPLTRERAIMRTVEVVINIIMTIVKIIT